MRSNIFIFLGIATLMALGSGCNLYQPTTVEDVRRFQTRAYNTPDTTFVSKVLISVLQDEGYIVKTADHALGLLTAEKESISGYSYDGSSNDPEEVTYEVQECMANITGQGNATSIRINFRKKGSNFRGAVIAVKNITSQQVYSDFFTKLDAALYNRSMNR